MSIVSVNIKTCLGIHPPAAVSLNVVANCERHQINMFLLFLQFTSLMHTSYTYVCMPL